jgi:hypothetical protein
MICGQILHWYIETFQYTNTSNQESFSTNNSLNLNENYRKFSGQFWLKFPAPFANLPVALP